MRNIAVVLGLAGGVIAYLTLAVLGHIWDPFAVLIQLVPKEWLPSYRPSIYVTPMAAIIYFLSLFGGAISVVGIASPAFARIALAVAAVGILLGAIFLSESGGNLSPLMFAAAPVGLFIAAAVFLHLSTRRSSESAPKAVQQEG